MNNSIYYHYTTITGCHGIITSGKMWFTDYRFLNDNQELKLGLSKLLTSFSEDERRSFENAFIVHEINTPHYVLSLSQSPEILSQWRGYAADGTGVAIGFSNQIMELAGISLVECKYTNYEEYLEILTTKYDSLIKSVHQEHTTIANLERFVIKNSYEFKELVKDIMSIKNLAFQEEREVRAVYSVNHPKIKTRLSGESIVPYAEVNLWNENKKFAIENFIHEIWLGPKCDMRNEIALKLFNIKYIEFKKFDCGYN